ncbi:hypothetical protein NDU88_000961 [Pleurodeles waltl]|uniref:Uncharacterized protein n=1 Tax=Pleurodeles waltl TaxID=8319 RepID=A0AAV7R9P5_PLEWA|nr:hypothetical protein NDU88_000961 [Pleurodeles waltl]
MVAQVIPPCSTDPPTSLRSADATDRILQEITAVGQRLEAMDLKISDLSAASTSIRADIARFQVTVTDLDQRLMTVEDHITAMPDQNTEMQSLRARETMSIFLAYRNIRNVQTSRPFLKTSSLNSRALLFPRRWSFKEPTELVLYIKQPLDDLALLSHASSATSRPTKSSQWPDLRARTL